MRAILVTPDHKLVIGEAPRPAMGPEEVRIAVHATAVNRADLLQRIGKYPPPPGASEIIGMECAGVVSEIGAKVHGWSVGDRVMALLPGGGYAEEAVVHHGSVMRVPDALSDIEAAAMPEVFLTSFLTVFLLGRLRERETLLVHGGGSGIGTAATTLAKLAGARVIVTAGSDEKCARCIAHGADAAINYRTEDFVERARGANVILDHIGARYLARDLDALATDGRIVVIGSMGGERSTELDVGKLLTKRAQILGSTLRSRANEEKAAIVSSFIVRFGADLDAGRVRPVVETVLPLERAEEAFALMDDAEHFGKIVLRVR